MGVTVRQKAKGRGKPWWVFIAYNGQRTSKKVGDKAAAEEVASTIRAELKLGNFSFEEEKPVSTFKEYAESWLDTRVSVKCKRQTKEGYEDALNLHIIPVFGDKSITEIKKGAIKNFLFDKLNQGYSISTVKQMKNVIAGVFNKAVDDEIIPANPAHILRDVFNGKKGKESIDPLDRDELNLLLNAVQENYSEHHALFLLLARAGLRIGEALALQWGDIDFNGRFIDVKRTLVKGRIETPKSGKQRRVDMSRQLTEVLRAHLIESKKKGFVLGLGGIPEYVFTNEAGNPIDVDNWRRRVFNKALEKASLRKIRIHDLRHSYATLRISKGDNIQDVSNQLGHHSVKLTLDVYSHWMPGKKKAEVDALDDAEYDLESEKAENEE